MLKRLLLILLAAVALVAVAFYLRPLAVTRILQRGLLSLAGFRNHYVRVGAYRIHYLIGGHGPPLVLLHGHPSRALEWGPLLPPLAREHRVVALDFLGYGESDAPEVDYSIPMQAGIVEGLLDPLKLTQADVLGFSMGGWVALRFAADHPGRVRRLVLVGSGGLKFETDLTADSLVPPSFATFSRLVASEGGRRLPDFLARDLYSDLNRRAPVLRPWAASLLSFRDAMDGRLAGVRMPTLIVWGKAERMVPYEVALRLQRELPQARLLGVEGAGHLVLWEAADRVLPEVLAFLR